MYNTQIHTELALLKSELLNYSSVSIGLISWTYLLIPC